MPPGELRKLISTKQSFLIAASIFFVTLSIFWYSRVHQVTDSSYSMLLSESLIHHRSFDLDGYALPRGEPVWFGDYFKYGNIYQLEVVNGHIYYYFPPGSSILSIPFVAVMNSFGISATNADGTYNPHGEATIEAIISALLMAGLASIFFHLARMALPISWSVVVALGGALGTQVWSTASRSLWTDTWGSFLLGFVVLMLLGAATDRIRLKPILLATLLSWMYIVRPTFAVHIIAITIYMFLFYRSIFLRYAIVGAAWFAVFVLYSWSLFGHVLPSYYRASRLQFGVFWMALAGNLISPGRGLLVYVPVLFFIAYLLVRYRRQIVYPRLAVLSVAVIAAHVAIISCFIHWWGGHGFGARFSTGLVPWFVLLAILGIQARLAARGSSVIPDSLTRKLELTAGAGLLFISIVINGLGATSRATWLWNMRPLNIDEHPERNWDWRQPQFLAGMVHAPLPKNILVATFDRVDFTTPGSAAYLWYGWSPAEPAFRWTEAKEAALVFRLNAIQDLQLTAKLHAFVIPNQHPEQRLSVALNGKPISKFSFNDETAHEITLVLPSNLLRQQNFVEFFLPDAVSPNSLGRGEDWRPLGIAVHWIQFSPKAAGYWPQSYNGESLLSSARPR
jgi:hypothetical protein